MNNMLIIGVITAFYTLISQVALSLGLATTTISYPDGLTDMGATNVFEILLRLPIWAINSFSAIMQLAFFTTDLPTVISSIVFLPILMMLYYLAVITVRGGAS